MIRKLMDDTCRELAILQLQSVTGIILQRYFRRCCLLCIQISVGRIGHQLIAVTVHVKVTFRHFWILSVEVVLLPCLCAPARCIVRLLNLQRNGLGSIIVQTCHDGDGTIAASRLEVAKVVLPLAVVPLAFFLLVAWVCL